MTAYKEFIYSKIKQVQKSGFTVKKLNKYLFPFQEVAVKKALEMGRYALFEDCGLGKSIQQLAWADAVVKHTGGNVLILAPLSVAAQTIAEGVKFEIEVKRYSDDGTGILITNYEQLDNVNASKFEGIVLDESSILRNFSGVYRNQIIEMFLKTPYKLACTATPSPNDELEIGNHSEFLNVMDSRDMRAMFFTTDKDLIDGEKYRLKKSAVNAFYKWVGSWSCFITKPSDLGFIDEGYILPELKINEYKLQTEKRENETFFNDEAVSATAFNSELRATMQLRVNKTIEIFNSIPKKESVLIWCKHNEEADMIRQMIPEATEVRGSDTIEKKEKSLLGFANGEIRVLITKAKIAQFGMNFQMCSNQIFASFDFSFESLYQAIRRSYRFGQKNAVNIHLVTTDTMTNVIKAIKEKTQKFESMQKGVVSSMKNEKQKTNTEDKMKDVIKPDYRLIHGDCVAEVKSLPDNSVDYSFFSPPFGAMYVFSDDPRDMSNVNNDEQFMQHFGYLVEELYRVIKAGRLCSLHVMQSTTLLGRDGYYSIKDFRGEVIRLFQSKGFYFHGEHMIRKDPKTAAIRTKNRQLMHGTTKKDSSIVRPGLADYIITFRKAGENAEPIKNNLPFELWCQMAEPVWLDMNESDTIRYTDGKDDKSERHITPTQLRPIEWCYLMWTNKGDTVLSPFSGVASEGVVALRTGRKYIGIELKKSYFQLSAKNMAGAERCNDQITMDDLLPKE